MLLVTGGVVMAAGQLLLALADDAGWAVVARVLVGAGDAMTFISVIRLVPAWFAPRQVPVMTQVTGIVGQVGQILSAFPLVALLHGPGWTAAYGGAAAVGVVVALLVLVVLRDAPAGTVVGSGPVSLDQGPRRPARRRSCTPAPGSGSGPTSPSSTPASCSACSGASRS